VEPTWTVEQVLALAPDAGSVAAARRLAGAGSWSGAGTQPEPAAVWGECAGSGTVPYRTVVDLGGPAYRCSCPSRKFPCKHALGLLLLWSAGGVNAGLAPEWAASWLDGRAAAAADRAAAAPVTRAAPDADAARDRAEKRRRRVAAGVEELDRWLLDQVRAGLGPLRQGGYRHVEPVAARMVDAQAPGLAAALRRLPGVAAGRADWPGPVLEELGLLRLAVTGHRALDRLPAGLAAAVRREVGYPVAREDVLAGPAVADRWLVVGQQDAEQERLTVRRVWLLGERTGRPALVLSFAAAGQTLDASLLPGAGFDGDLHFYPGGAPLRALVGERRGGPAAVTALAGGTLAEAAAAYGAAVAADPWTDAWPAAVAGLVPVPGEPWQVVDATGRRAPLLGEPWRLLAVSGGHPVTAVVEHTPAGLRALSVLDPERPGLVPL
jgi:hypothetical protein